MSYFTDQGKQLHYTEQGSGTPLLLLHGNTASANMFCEIAPLYAAHYKVILPDFLGHGKSERLAEFPPDLWYEEACQVIALIREKQYKKVNLLGTSGGALVAINVGLEAPDLVERVIADSFEGERALPAFTENLAAEREQSKQETASRQFYQYMHGADWEAVVDNDTGAMVRHSREIGRFFHRPLSELRPEILLTGSLEDEFVSFLAPDYFARTYAGLVEQMGHGRIHLFPAGGHPALLSNRDEFYEISRRFLEVGESGISNRL